MSRQRRYLSYLLRLWQTSDGGRLVWRASLESPSTQERQGFASMQELFNFLQAQADRAEQNGEEEEDRMGSLA